MLSQEEISSIAHLARLKLSAEEVQRLTNEISKIMDLVAQLPEDTENAAPFVHPLEEQLSQRLRDDQVTANITPETRAKYQELAPATKHGVYLVPQVIEGNDGRRNS
jgi:aspartyl-tRNA(Asn)/glutamyl-tRNA(Gln) amidotransferase subunit C